MFDSGVDKMARKDKNDSQVYRELLKKKYAYTWDNYTNHEYVNKILSHASKNGKGNYGYPDAIYVNENSKLVILVENKPSVGQHRSISEKFFNPEKYAVDGIKHYLSHFIQNKIVDVNCQNYFKDWKFIGLAISGDIEDEYNHLISTFIILNNKITEQTQIQDILDEQDYLSLFDNINEEEIISKISFSSKKINKWLRSVDSQKRPILLSALMICLFDFDGNDFKNNYASWRSQTIISNIPLTVDRILREENIPTEKIEVIKSELSFLAHDQDLHNTNVIKDILDELKDIIIPLFKRKSNYDIIGKFYEEFLRYAGVANVKKGIVLTPKHVTTLFTDLIDIKVNDVFLDPACGTGAFLIAAMNKLENLINQSNISNKDERIRQLKNNQLIGFEKSSTMYALAISNMMFRGDGKSQIFFEDFFSKNADNELEKLKKRGIIPTIGFVNPPYGGKDNKDNPTKKEIQFLTKMLDNVTRYGIIIAPLSTYFKDDAIRNKILSKHTLKYVINMPKDLFMPNAATNTAIAVFETNKPQNNQPVIFYNLDDDGYVLSKAKGRTDTYNKWPKIKEDLLNKIKNPNQYINKDIKLVQTSIKDNDEWLYQAHAKTDYSKLNKNSFVNSIKSYMVFEAKSNMNLLESNLDEITLLNIISDYYSDGVENGN